MNNEYSSEALQKVIESAKRMNVELDEKEAVEWLESIRQDGCFRSKHRYVGFQPDSIELFPQDRKIG